MSELTETTGAIEGAVQKLLADHQKRADEEKLLAPKRDAAQAKIDTLVDSLAGMGTLDEAKMSTEMAAAFLLFQQTISQRAMAGDPNAQMAMAKFDDAFMQDFGAYMQTVQSDPAKLQNLQQTAQDLAKDLVPPKVQVGMPTIEIAVSEPEDSFGEWTFAVVPVVVDENFKAKLLNTLEFDLGVTMKITPPEGGLSGDFNAPSIYIKAGDKVKHLSISAKTAENGPMKHLIVSGEIYKGGQLVQELKFAPTPLQKFDPNAMDMDALMRMMGGGGPGGPN